MADTVVALGAKRERVEDEVTSKTLGNADTAQ